MLPIAEIQKLYSKSPDIVYANTPSLGLISNTSIERINDFMRSLYSSGSIRTESFLSEDLPFIKQNIGSFVDADPEEIALIPNFSFGLNAILPSLVSHKSILLFEDDYPSLTQPFVLNDFDITWSQSEDGFHFDLNKMEETIKKKNIKVVAVSEVQYLTGFWVDIEALGEICKSTGAILIVDGTQSLGAIPYSFHRSAADIYIASNYKWMNAGLGTGIMLVKRSFLSEHEPKIGGFGSFIQRDGEWKYAPSIESYEPGHLNMGGFLVLDDAIDIKMKLGVDNIFKHNKELLDLLVNDLKQLKIEIIGPYDNRYRSTIVYLKDDVKIRSALQKHNIIFKTRNDGIRLGLHFYNTEGDVKKITAALEAAR
jgi:cysteine desulfurase/selenocysteine lyase